MSSLRLAAFFALAFLVTYRETTPPEFPPNTPAPEPPQEEISRHADTPRKPMRAFRSEDADCSGLKPRQVGDDVPAPVPLKRVDPVFKDVARHMRFEGALVLEVTVNRNGKVCRIKVIQPLHKLVDEPVVEALRQWSFQPTLRKGKPVSAKFPMTIRFGTGE